MNANLIQRKKYFEHGDLLIGKIGDLNTSGKSLVYLGSEKCLLGDAVYCLKHKQNPKYLSYTMNSSYVRKQIKRFYKGGTVFNFFLREIKQIKVPLPPLHIQDKIADILDLFSELNEELNEELKQELIERKKQYEYYRDFIIGRDEEEIKWEIKTLGEIATEIYTGNGITKDKVDSGNCPAIRYSDIYRCGLFIPTFQCLVNVSEIKNPKYCDKGDLLTTIASVAIEGHGRSASYLGNEKCLVGMATAVTKHNQNPKYLAYALSSAFCRSQIFKTVRKAAIYNFPISQLKQIKIPLPPLEEQEKIVSVLDKFYDIHEDFEKGIPGLIKDNQNQYEYYRDAIIA